MQVRVVHVGPTEKNVLEACRGYDSAMDGSLARLDQLRVLFIDSRAIAFLTTTFD